MARRYAHMKRVLVIAATSALAALPLFSAAAMPRVAAHAPATRSDNAIVLVHGDRVHALDHAARVNRDDGWSRGLRRFRDTFDGLR
jgi:hypothetical protein